MRLTTPRVRPVAVESWTEEQREIVEPMLARGPLLNIFRTLLAHPPAAKAFLVWGGYILGRNNTLPRREREIVILRTGFLCRSGYEWTQHVPIARRAGLADDEIARIKLGADAPGWSEADAALLRATDDLHREQFITEPVWAELARHFGERQRMDVVFTVGQYTGFDAAQQLRRPAGRRPGPRSRSESFLGARSSPATHLGKREPIGS